MSSVTRTIIDDVHSGSTWRVMMRACDAPKSRVAAMNSELRKVSVSARAMRA